MSKRKFHILLTPAFIVSLGILVTNDFFLKTYFPGLITGKLSDFAGLFIFPAFLTAFFPKKSLLIYISTGIAFIIWKSQFSQRMIDFINSFGMIRVGRVVDFGDLVALLILPVSYKCFSLNNNRTSLTSSVLRNAGMFGTLLFSVFAFSATTLESDRTVALKKEEVLLKLSPVQIEDALRQNPRISYVRIKRQSDVFPANEYPDVTRYPNVYYGDFILNEKHCDSRPEFGFTLEEKSGATTLTGGFVHFSCGKESMLPDVNTALKDYEKQFSDVFADVAIKPLSILGSK